MLTTDLLCRHQDLKPLVASWLRSEWPDWYGEGGPGNLPGDIEAFAASPTTLPVGMLIFAAATPVGFAALKRDSIPSHAHLAPWAGAGYVLPEHRGRGIGGELLRALVAQAASLGYPTVYCGTSTANRLLERSGWQRIETIVHAGKPLAIYRSAP